MTFLSLLRRFGLLVLVVWVASTINFFVPRIAPRNPIEDKLLQELENGGGSVDISSMIEAYNAKFGLDKPLIEQYLTYMKDTLSFDLGYSIAYYPTRTAEIVAHAMPWTIGLLLTTTLMGFVFGTILGALTVWRGASAVWRWFVPFMMIFSAIPFYLVGLILIYIFAYRLHWFPLSGGMSLSTTGSLTFAMAVDIFYHSLLPAFSILVATIGVWALSMRGMMVTVQGEDYMTFAEALGLKNRRRFLQYGVRNAVLPQVTQLALSMGHILSGSILVELVFGYPGMGQQLFRAVQHLDYYVIYGIVFILICTIALAMLLMDLVYPLLDPRVRYARVAR